MKETFEKIYTENIKREGADKLLDYLRKSDFYTAPASSKFHGNYEGGLLEHSINVYNRLIKIVKEELGENYTEKYSNETLAIVALLHDLCKIHYYKTEYRNVKNERGEWVKAPYFAVNNTFPFGHGEKSVFMINTFMRLSGEEAMAINWHMGGFDDRVRSNPNSMGESFKIYPLCLFLHIADLTATYIDEKTV
jgi:hypothetical protein